MNYLQLFATLLMNLGEAGIFVIGVYSLINNLNWMVAVCIIIFMVMTLIDYKLIEDLKNK